ncbi:hypothetical protein [Frankia sp. Cr2]|uniref:hypothetical protein n=1 Tax=Frankia sp. Cr2 TaxID=3073932 RepID=UPI002AD3FD04|nr:hypothetical protein [Frankia sp. Cr2]
MAQIGGRTVATGDVGIMGAGVVVFVSSFLPWYGASFGGYHASISGWNSGFIAWFPILLCLAVAGVVAAATFGNVRLPTGGPVGPSLALVLGGGVAVLLILLRWITLPDAGSSLFAAQIKSGAKVGLFLGLIGAAAMTGFAVLRLLGSGESIPGRGLRPAGGGTYGQQPPPYGQQPPPPYGQQPPAGGAPYGQQPPPPYGQQPPAGGAPYGQQPPPAGGYDQPPHNG